jgi:N-methylhydantoinase A
LSSTSRNGTPESGRLICGIDIGGTFTDCAVVDESGSIVTSKVPSTPANPAEAFVSALESAAKAMGTDLQQLLARSEQVMHGTTVGTNAVVQRRGARVGLIATAGHGEAILHMRGSGRTAGVSVEKMLDIPGSDKPEPLVPRSLIKEVVERVDCDGDVVVPLNEASAERAVAELRDAGVESIAICLLWSFLNPAHEQAIKAIAKRLAPDAYVTASHELVPVWGEYERTVATVLNAYIGPITQRYLDDLGGKMRTAGFDRDVLIVQSTGGVTSAPRAGEGALLTLGSGPVAGMMGTAFLAAALGLEDVIAVDMGGTSFDIGVVRGGVPVTTDVSVVEQYQYYVPTVDVVSIGAGGGSIASVDEISGGLLVGPESAGATPGPACYSRGGTEPTVTDANLLLGYLDPDFFLGGGMRLDRDLAERAVEKIAQRSGLDLIHAAAGIVKVVEFRMADLIRKTTIEKGFDPRDFTLFVYGGAGASHGVVLARELGIKKVVVPMGNVAGVWSALGAASANVLAVFRLSDPQTAPFDAARLTGVYDELEQRARAELHGEGFGDESISLQRRASLRYRYQIHEVEVNVAAGELGADDASHIVSDFEAAYESLYGKGSGFSAAGFELTSFKVLASGILWKPELTSQSSTNGRPRSTGRDSRQIFDSEAGEFLTATVIKGEELGQGETLEGPGIIELPWTTVVVHPRSSAEVDHLGNLIISIEGGPA